MSERKGIVIGATCMIGVGLLGAYGLGAVWHYAGLNPDGDAAMIAVTTIMPGMCIPYVLVIACIVGGIQGYWEAWRMK